MHIDWPHFTPIAALVGGILIGIAAALMLLLNGRVAGISGIAGGLLRLRAGDTAWRAAFVLGLVGAPLLYRAVAQLPEARIDADYLTLIAAGLLVGVGTRYASGCTSGHGVCGIARRSPRSIAATLTFMAAGFLTVYLLRN